MTVVINLVDIDLLPMHCLKYMSVASGRLYIRMRLWLIVIVTWYSNTYSLTGQLVVCGCGLWDTKSYLLSYNEHMIQEKDLNLLYWQPNPLCDVFQITHNVLVWRLYIDIVKFFDEYMQQLKYIFVKNYRSVFGTKTLNIIAYLEPILQ